MGTCEKKNVLPLFKHCMSRSRCRSHFKILLFDVVFHDLICYGIVNICQCIKASNKISLVFSFLSSKQITPVNGANGTTPSTPTSAAPASSTDIKVEDEKPVPDFLDSLSKPEEKSKIGFPASQMNNLNVGDYRTLVKTLVCGVKTITWGCASCKVSI